MRLLLAVVATCVVSGFFGVHAARADGVVCSNTSFQGDNGYREAFQDVNARRIYRCPAGATSLRLVFAGTSARGTPIVEVPNQSDGHLTISVETGLSIPSANGPAQTAAALTGRKIQVLCEGQAACTIPAGGLLVTDPVSVSVPKGGIIAINEHFSHSQAASGPSQPVYGGSLVISGANLADFTLADANPTPQNAAHDLGPQAIIGTPLVPTVSACIVGDSRAVGLSGAGVSTAKLASGGSGFTADDVNQVMENISSGGSPDSTSTPASYVIRSVSNGAVTSFYMWNGGHYTVNGLDGNVTPSGIQATRPLGFVHGSGFTVSLTPDNFSTSAGIFYDPTTTATGYVQKGLADGNIPAASFSRSADRLVDWLGGDAARLATIAASGCTVAIIELGGNDLNAGYTVEQIAVAYVALANQLKAIGVERVYGMTILPLTRSKNAYRDAAGQYWPNAEHEATRQQINHWIRSVQPPFSGEFDAALEVEVDAQGLRMRNGGRWITDGTPNYPTLDRIHLNVGTSIRAAAAISKHVSILLK